MAFEFWPAKVVDNVDTDKEGKIKFRIESLMDSETVNDTDLPWARQFISLTGGSGDHGTSCIPEINSMVWVFFVDETYFKKAYYVADLQLAGLHPHELFNDNIKSDISSNATYPNAKYNYYKNDICIGVDSSVSNPEYFVVHPRCYLFIDSTGKLKIKSDVNILIESTTGIEIKSGSVSTEKSVLGDTLVNLLTQLLTAISTLTVTCTAPGSPSSVPINAATFTALIPQLQTALSALNKNN